MKTGHKWPRMKVTRICALFKGELYEEGKDG